MAVWSQIAYSVACSTQRFDSDYWKPEYIENENTLKGMDCTTIGEASQFVRCGPFGSNLLCENYVPNGVLVLRPFNLKQLTVERGNLAYVTEEVCRLQRLGFYEEGDIMFARVGDVRAGVLRAFPAKVTISPNVIAARMKAKAPDPYFTVAFLNTRFGLSQLIRGMKTVAQPTITVDLVKAVLVPNAPASVQQAVRSLVQSAFEQEEIGLATLAEAEAILTAALGLDRVDLTPRLFYEDTYAHAAARMDAEYFSPRMQNVIATLSTGGKTIGDVAPLAKRRFKAVSGKPFDYIEIADIGTAGTAGSNTVAGEEAPSRATWIVKPGDIITTTVRPIRRLSAIILPEQDGFVCSSGFAVFRPRDIEPELLLTYLRLPLVAELLDLHTTASMYPAISTADLLRIPFRQPDAQASAQIVAKVRESFAARSESLRLLDQAKAMVEDAIRR